MRIHRVVEKTRAEGPGLRLAIWTQGCENYCPGCYARELWDADGGTEIPAGDLIARITAASSELEGVTFLGGEPFLQARELALAANAAQKLGLSVVTFTGFVYEKLLDSGDPDAMKLLRHTDVLIDGPYVEAQRDFSRPLVGSKNQRFLFFTNRYTIGDFIANPNRIEIRVDRDGSVRVNGMGDFSKLERSLADSSVIKGE
jgi:anaerobic ribonucleoside-triphosphate reductase activating protein